MTVSQRAGALRAHAPRTVEDAISPGGRIAWVLELYLFGAWLVGGGADHRPLSGRGRKADRTEVLRLVAVAMVAMWRREEARATGPVGTGAPDLPATRPLARSEVSYFWREVHGEQHDRDWFKSRMASAGRYLAAYLEDLRTGRASA
jgi:hypothetical protein